MKISSKRDGDEADVDSYNVSVSQQNEEASKDAEFNSSEGGNESVPTSQQTISRSSEAGSNQQQNQVGTNPTFYNCGTSNQIKPNVTTINNFFLSQTQQIAGSQPKSNSSRGPSSSHETQSPIQVTASNNQKVEVNLNASGGSTTKQHLEPSSSNLETNKTSVGTTNAPNSSNASKGKLNNSTFSHQLPSETAATKYVVSGLSIMIFSMCFIFNVP